MYKKILYCIVLLANIFFFFSYFRNVKFFLSRPKAVMPYHAGYEEDKFLRSLAPLNNTEIELLASNCTEVLLFYTFPYTEEAQKYIFFEEFKF